MIVELLSICLNIQELGVMLVFKDTVHLFSEVMYISTNKTSGVFNLMMVHKLLDSCIHTVRRTGANVYTKIIYLRQLRFIY